MPNLLFPNYKQNFSVTCVQECSRQTEIMIHCTPNFLNSLMAILTRDFIKVNYKNVWKSKISGFRCCNFSPYFILHRLKSQNKVKMGDISCRGEALVISISVVWISFEKSISVVWISFVKSISVVWISFVKS